ncbi:hypothetical protein NDU88_000460 [Pleurodeles waltl]|uniref:Uncharacterized protein n=1 Tax=Pleurodeles waltl TaxID=8319 RepID=A0AAV7URR7_PLEWA|nr:hypothetical protein NDU88_000460 [Pleurodeles waltl]
MPLLIKKNSNDQNSALWQTSPYGTVLWGKVEKGIKDAQCGSALKYKRQLLGPWLYILSVAVRLNRFGIFLRGYRMMEEQSHMLSADLGVNRGPSWVGVLGDEESLVSEPDSVARSIRRTV